MSLNLRKLEQVEPNDLRSYIEIISSETRIISIAFSISSSGCLISLISDHFLFSSQFEDKSFLHMPFSLHSVHVLMTTTHMLQVLTTTQLRPQKTHLEFLFHG